MSNSMSLEYEAIQPTQSTECVKETESQEDFPDTQQSINDYDVYYPDELTDDDDDPCNMMECTGCSPLLLEVKGGKPRLCVTCRYYKEYE